jgi:hypothetical protein
MAVGAAAIGGILVVVAAALFFGIYLAVPELNHFYALLAIGVIALLFAAFAYLAQAFTRDPVVQRAATLGFLGMGFVVLFLDVAFGGEGDTPSFLGRLAGLIVLALLLVVALGGILWRVKGRMTDAVREERRDSWAQRPVASAFDYPAAQAVAPPPTAPANAPSSPPAR